MRLKIEILTPVHIGSGDEISPSEYYFDKNTVTFHRVNLSGLFSDTEFQPYLEAFIEEASKKRYLGNLVKNPKLLKKHSLYSLPVDGDAIIQLLTNQTVVKEFVKSAGRVYIPGSSLKGAILSAIMWFSLKGMYSKQRNVIEEAMRSGTQKDYREILGLVLSTLGSNPEMRSFSRWLSLSDSELKKPEEALKVCLSSVTDSKKEGLKILYEVLRPDQTFEIEMDSSNCRLSEEQILKITHEFYIRVLEKDGAKVDKKPYLLRIGQGSTAFSTSSLILAEDLGIKGIRARAPRTRKRIDGTIPMGFVRVYPSENANSASTQRANTNFQRWRN